MFWVQKSIIRLCNLAGKPVVTATQMLDSMITNPRPTRAEATDVANAVLDGTDCVMLSGETAAGSYPLQAVQIMSNICQEAESCVDNFALCQGLLNATLLSTPSSEPMSTIESLASSAVLTAAKVQASCIVVLASSGSAARLIAKYRPSQPVVVGVVPRERRARIGFAETRLTGHAVARQCLLTRGLIPVLVSPKSEEEAEKDPAGAAKLCVNEAVRITPNERETHALPLRSSSPSRAASPRRGRPSSRSTTWRSAPCGRRSRTTCLPACRQCAVIRVVICPTPSGA